MAELDQVDAPLSKTGRPTEPPHYRPYKPNITAEDVLEAAGPLGEAGTVVGEALRTGRGIDPRDVAPAMAGVMVGATPEGAEKGVAGGVAKVASKAVRRALRPEGESALAGSAAQHVSERGIAAVAIRDKETGQIFSGQEIHATLMHKAADELGLPFQEVFKRVEDGYLDAAGNFVNRKEAAKIAKAAGQIKSGAELSREGLTAENLSRTITPPQKGQVTVQGGLITGSLNPLEEVPFTYKGKPPAQWTPGEYKEVGDHFGVPNLGPETPPATFLYENGGTFDIPGGLDGTFTYYDLLSMKAQGIDASRIPKALHTEIHKKLLRTMTPPTLTTEHVWNGLVFGLTSPNQPLFPNQLAASRLRFRDPAMIDELAGMIPWKAGQTVAPELRNEYSRRISTAFGLQGSEQWSLKTQAPGLGVSGSADYTRAAELAQMFKQDPKFFTKSASEGWDQFAERIASQVTGLGAKTASLGVVWQDPATAAISAIDRHMAQEFRRQGGLFKDKLEEMAWQNKTLQAWNKKNPGKQVETFDAMLNTSGSDGFLGEKLLDYVQQHGTPGFRGKSGAINPNLPPHLAQAQWVVEPKEVLLMGENYRRALAYNNQLAQQQGLNLFGSQWLEWDRIRRRLEPHENMFPGLERLPAPSQEQLRGVDVEHMKSGHKVYGKDEEKSLKPTKARPSPARFGYFALPLAGGTAGAVMMQEGSGQEGVQEPALKVSN